MSNSPGSSTRPPASTTWSALGALSPPAAATETMRPSRTTTSEAGPSFAFSLSNTRALRIRVVPLSGCETRFCRSTSASRSACFCRVSSAAALAFQPSSISCRKPGKMNANSRGSASVVAQTNCGVRPTPVTASSCTLRFHRGRLAARDLDFGHLAHAQHAARNQRQLAVGALGQCRQRDGNAAWRAAERRIERGAADRLLALVGSGFPGDLVAFAA